MKLGAFEIYPVTDGRFRLDGGAMFGVVPKALWERCCPADEQNRIPLSLTCLLIRAHGKNIFVDTGLGDKEDAKFYQEGSKGSGVISERGQYGMAAMKERYLEVTFRNGKTFTAYLYLPRHPRERSVRTEEAGHGMVIDYGHKDHPIGAELTAPNQVTLERLNAILKRLNLPPMKDADLSPLAVA